MDRVADQFLSTLKALKFNEKVESGDFASQLPNERHRRGRRASGGEQVIHDQHPFSHTNRIAMDGKGVRTVLEVIFDFKVVGGQLARFSDWNEPGIQPVCQYPAENEPARLDADDFGDPLSLIVGGQFIGNRRKGAGVFEQGGDIVEENAGFGEVGDFPNESAIVDRESSIRAGRLVSWFCVQWYGVNGLRRPFQSAGLAHGSIPSPGRFLPVFSPRFHRAQTAT